MSIFNDFMEELQESPFDEIPLLPAQYVTDVVNVPSLSGYQLEALEKGTQIFRRDTLLDAYGMIEGQKRWEDTYTEIILQWGKGCVAAGTKVYDAVTGYWTPIEQLKAPGRIASVGHNGKHLLEERTAVESMGMQPCVKVTTGLGLELIVSQEHQFVTKDGLKAIKDLQPGDFISMASDLTVESPVWQEPNYIKLLAHLITRAHAYEDRLVIGFMADEPNAEAEFAQLAGKYEEPTVRTQTVGTRRVTKYTYTDELLKYYDKHIGIKRQQIPDVIYGLSREQLQLFFSRFKVKFQNKHALIVTHSKRLATAIQLLTPRLGSYTQILSSDLQTRWFVTVKDWRYKRLLWEDITLIDRQHKLDLLIEDNGKRRVSRVSAEYAKQRFHGDTFWDAVYVIDDAGVQEVFNISAPYYQNYLANGVYNGNSGKDFISTIIMSYIVYELLCMKNPQRYFGKPDDDAIDLLNVAINAEQASRVFFNNFKKRIEQAEWFDGKYDIKGKEIVFEKSITAYSGHSQFEAAEGLNLLTVILDEISGFAESNETGIAKLVTAETLYNAHSAAVQSRFIDDEIGQAGKVILLSFPRHKNCFISRRFREVAETIEQTFQHTFKMNEELPDGIEENEFTIEWIEEDVVRYKEPGVFAVKRPSWRVNPRKTVNGYKKSFFKDPIDSLSRFACNPPDALFGFFKSRAKIELAFNEPDRMNGIDDNDSIIISPNKDFEYYIHVDLAQKHDSCVMSMLHVDHWLQPAMTNIDAEEVPFVIVDIIKVWKPAPGEPVNFSKVRDFMDEILAAGFNIKSITFDQYRSEDFIVYYNNKGVQSYKQSVLKPQYLDLSTLINEERITGPYNEVLVKELRELQHKGANQVDHPRTGCFVGETRIRLADGSTPRIETLDGEEVWVYAKTPADKTTVAKARGRFTKEVDYVLDLVLDNNCVVRCTPEHPFRLVNGEYKPARDLRPKIDSLAILEEGKRYVLSKEFVKLSEPVKVYDLEVDRYENFMLLAGPVVHNSKDIADSIAGASSVAVKNTERFGIADVQVLDASSFEPNYIENRPKGVIVAPKREEMPDELKDWLDSFKML